MGISKVGLGDRAETFLASCVPHLHLGNLIVHLKRFYFEIDADRIRRTIVEGLWDEPEQHGSLSRVAVPDQNYLEQGVLRLYCGSSLHWFYHLLRTSFCRRLSHMLRLHLFQLKSLADSLSDQGSFIGCGDEWDNFELINLHHAVSMTSVAHIEGVYSSGSATDDRRIAYLAGGFCTDGRWREEKLHALPKLRIFVACRKASSTSGRHCWIFLDQPLRVL